MSINFTEANFKQEEAKDNKKAKSLPETKIQASEAPTLKEKTPTKPSGVKKIPAKHKNEKDTQEKSKAQESMSKGVEHQPLNVESSEELEEEIKKSPKKLLKRKVISDSSESEDETGISSPKTMNENKIQDSEAAAGNKPKSRIRKTRKIMKTKHFKNDRGMMVTKVVEEIESYSESEPDMPSDPKMAVTPTTHGNNTSKTASIPTKSNIKGNSLVLHYHLNFVAIQSRSCIARQNIDPNIKRIAVQSVDVILLESPAENISCRFPSRGTRYYGDLCVSLSSPYFDSAWCKRAIYPRV
ncbi:hypothetical protein AX774_g2591 [Zancudomyces culisetae]|uniref:Uncharacterized protein n=1 Tax=Zancudomyces culisetae TaxID=1213189 RepID=A0A1R1PSL9_ZANCU|nr:hypothetical protein AX774_g2591 [Zancudomyces culisetae]|eukprot:OMH83893.1 hypothetical protein AX774_g2591 [Zancudomyces culisetae]